MGVKANTTRDVFPGYVTKVFPPIPASWFDPKAWGIAQDWVNPTRALTDSAANFQAAGVQIADAVYILSDELTATTVLIPPAPTTLLTVAMPAATYFNVLYKVGHDHHHTIQSLAQIVSQRAITFFTLHYHKLYTGASVPNWNTDETGEVYVISHDIQKAVWLDDDIKLPYSGPSDLSPSPPPRSIDEWEALFPGQPRPDYPSGLQPGGILRKLLEEEHGSLKDAYDFYYL